MRSQFTLAEGKTIALLLWFLDENMDTRAGILTGILKREGDSFILDRGPLLPMLHLPPSLLLRMRIVPDEARDIFKNVQLYIPATLKDFPRPEQEENFEKYLIEGYSKRKQG